MVLTDAVNGGAERNVSGAPRRVRARDLAEPEGAAERVILDEHQLAGENAEIAAEKGDAADE